jgi:hypothetical protein
MSQSFVSKIYLNFEISFFCSFDKIVFFDCFGFAKTHARAEETRLVGQVVICITDPCKNAFILHNTL